MSITAAMVKELREMSGAGMMDAKNALVENNGDIETAMDWLRTKGLAKAAKKSGRVAAEGLIGVAVKGGVAVAVEVNSETDFVAKNAEFQAMVAAISGAAISAKDVADLNATDLGGKSVEATITDKIATIGENMGIRRLVRVEGDSVATYIHTQAAEGMGRIGVLVALKGTDNGIGKQIAMHIAASNPASLDEASLDQAIVDREKNILTEQARESGKPEAVIEKMIEGRIKKFLADVTLVNQQFVINPDITVGQAAKDAGVTILAYARVEVGEGIEKVVDNLAEEVAKLRA